MTNLRKQIAQMLVMGFNGTCLNEQHVAYRWVRQEGIGGVILFDENLGNLHVPKNLVEPKQIKLLTTTLQRWAQEYDPSLSLLISADVEGGEVDRLKTIPPYLTTLSARSLAKLSVEEFASEISKMAKNMHSLGFNLNFAPVVDLSFDTKNNFINNRGRSFAKAANEVNRLATLFVKIFHENGILCCYKHFPGHGSAEGDTHLGFVDVTSTFALDELAPYRELAKENKEYVMVMTAHVVNRHLDKTGKPATLSHPILTQLLRNELHYQGIIISDDMQMRAITQQYPLEEALMLAISAGVDMLIFGNQWGDHDASHLIDVIEELVRQKAIKEERIHAAYARILKFKSALHN
ncbi:MAG: hypothetical protein A3F18_08700 [Legionellales bacterium RIFCSPHIGHO2_12_FULL_37_14]|nr:MAG: hypothetical protein A3F18_08700 [Legionellales bacterium RIFCSPHIGHO2_12_FULL_37_14]